MLKIPDNQLYCYFDEKNQGPFTITELRNLFKCRLINRATPMWYPSLKNWVAVGDIPEFNRRSVPIPPPIPTLMPEKSKMWIFHRGEVIGATIDELRLLVEEKKFRRSDYIFQKQTNEWVRADQHLDTYKEFRSAPELESKPSENRESLKDVDVRNLQKISETEDEIIYEEISDSSFTEKVWMAIQENLFLDVLVLFLLTLGVMAYLYWPKPTNYETPLAYELEEPEFRESPEFRGLPEKLKDPTHIARTTDTTLMGYDISLRLPQFKNKYSNELQECKRGNYFDPAITRKTRLPIIVCNFKSGGSAQFYKEQVFAFIKKIENKEISLQQAATQLEKKTRQPTKIETFSEDEQIFCGSAVPFHEGEAIVMSNDLMKTIIQMYGSSASRCKEEVYRNTELGSVIYKNMTVQKLMASDLADRAKNGNRKTASDDDFEL